MAPPSPLPCSTRCALYTIFVNVPPIHFPANLPSALNPHDLFYLRWVLGDNYANSCLLRSRSKDLNFRASMSPIGGESERGQHKSSSKLFPYFSSHNHIIGTTSNGRFAFPAVYLYSLVPQNT